MDTASTAGVSDRSEPPVPEAPKTLVLDTGVFAAEDRADVVRETIASTVVHVDIDFPQEQGPAAVRGAITDWGPLRVCSVHSNATKVERTPRLARDGLEPRIFLALQMAGTSLIIQNGREAVLRPGDLAFSDSTSPYSLIDTEGIRQHFFSIPVAALALPQDSIARLAAVTLTPDDPVADLAAAYFGRLAARRDIFDGPGAEAIGLPSVELVRALLTTHLGFSPSTKESLQSSLRLRIMEYVRTHLGESNLSAAQIASAHSVSVRQLYRALEADGISLGESIREQRLEGCRRELGGPAAQFTPIAAIASRWGFSDASSFSRSFRTQYGMSPREWRDRPRAWPAGRT